MWGSVWSVAVREGKGEMWGVVVVIYCRALTKQYKHEI